MFTSDRSEQRKYLAEAWDKYNSNQPLEPLELQLAKIIENHPEYQKIIKDLETEYFPEQGKTIHIFTLIFTCHYKTKLTWTNQKESRRYILIC